MNNSQIKLLEQLNITLDENKIEILNNYVRIFLKKNSHVNLIAQNDEKFLFEKHIFDSLAINLFIKPKKNQTLLDIGTGGGFPAIPVAILYDNLNVYAIDSIRKKIKMIEEIKDELNLKNLFPVCERIENNKQQFDYVTSRAVASLDIILKYACPHLKKGGYFIAYKSKKTMEELKTAEKTIKNFNIKIIKIIEYTLPLKEKYERNLIIFHKP